MLPLSWNALSKSIFYVHSTGALNKAVLAFGMIYSSRSFQPVHQLGGTLLDGRWWLLVLGEVDEPRLVAHVRPALVVGLKECP